MILIFATHPLNFMSLGFFFMFFLLFTLFFVLLFFFNLIRNSFFQKRVSFKIFFNSIFIVSFIKKIYIMGFFKFDDFLKLSDICAEKNHIKSLFLIYNHEREKTQLLFQIRPPLIILVILSYFTLFFLKLAV